MKIQSERQKKKIQKQLLESKNLTDDQKIQIKLQKLRPNAVLSGSKSFKNVQNVMAKVYGDQQKQVVKYLNSNTKDEAKLTKPIYISIIDQVRGQNDQSCTLYKQTQLDFKNQDIVTSPLIEKEVKQHSDFERLRNNYNELFCMSKFEGRILTASPEPLKFYFPPSPNFEIKKENQTPGYSKKKIGRQTSIAQRFMTQHGYGNGSSSNKFRSNTLDLSPMLTEQCIELKSSQVQPIQSSDKKVSALQFKTPIIDSPEKLQQFEQDKKKIDHQVFVKLGMMSEKDKKLLQIQELQARALKMRIKINQSSLNKFDNPLFQMELPFPSQRRKKSPLISPQAIRIKTAQIQTSTSPEAASKLAGIRTQTHFRRQLTQSSQGLRNKDVFQETIATKEKIFGFCDNLAELQKQQREKRINDSEEVVQTIQTIKNELQHWQNNLVDHNDELEKDIHEQIKEQVIAYQIAYKQKLVRLR